MLFLILILVLVLICDTPSANNFANIGEMLVWIKTKVD